MRPVGIAYIKEAKNGNLGCATLRQRDILNEVHNYNIIPIRRYEKKSLEKLQRFLVIWTIFAAQKRSEMTN